MTILTVLDGPNLGVLAAIGFVYIILPLVALILLIWFFVKRRKKNKNK
jgi:F0F1-type ATP synthase assembly protein I